MNDTELHSEQLALFAAFNDRLQTQASAADGIGLGELAQQFDAMNAAPKRIPEEAPALVYRMLTVAPQLTSMFPRELLWYLGGECLHFMPDEEIASFTALDEQRRDALASGEPFNWQGARAAALGLQ
jgi:hypothetical protein